MSDVKMNLHLFWIVFLMVVMIKNVNCSLSCVMNILRQGCNSVETCDLLSSQVEARCSLAITSFVNTDGWNQVYFITRHASEMTTPRELTTTPSELTTRPCEDIISPCDDINNGLTTPNYDDGYTRGIYGTSAYKKGDTGMPYADAKARCELDGAHLVFIETQDEFNAIKAYDQSHWNFNGDICVGAERYPCEPLVFKWPCSGGNIKNSFWTPGDPNEVDESNIGVICARLRMPYFKLGDHHCSNYFYFLCEKD